MAVTLLIVLSLATSCGGHGSSDKSKDKNTDKSSSRSDKDSGAETSSETEKRPPFTAGDLTENYKYTSVRNDMFLGSGDLTLLDGSHTFSGSVPEDMDGVYGYLFDDTGYQIAFARSTLIEGRTVLLESFNDMLKDFYEDTGLRTIMISDIYSGPDADGGEEESESSEEETAAEPQQETRWDKPCFEHDTGLAVDLQLYLADQGTYPAFDGTGKYGWFADNCYRYGFIQRYSESKESVTGVLAQPQHFRYVGQPHAEIMYRNGLCLEEYLEFLRAYNFERPYSFETADGSGYALYYVPVSAEKSTNCPLPLKEDDSEYEYEISGDNMQGYIVCVKLQDSRYGDTAQDIPTDEGTSSAQQDDTQPIADESDLQAQG